MKYIINVEIENEQEIDNLQKLLTPIAMSVKNVKDLKLSFCICAFNESVYEQIKQRVNSELSFLMAVAGRNSTLHDIEIAFKNNKIC